MKKCAFIAMLVLLLAAQEHADAMSVRSYGVKVGLVRAGQTWDYSGVLSHLKLFDEQRSGISAGLYVEWLDLPVVSLVTGAEYVQRGCRGSIRLTSEGGPTPIATSTYNPGLDYVSFPILLKVRYGFSAGSVYALVGPRYEVLVSRHSSGVEVVFDRVKSEDYGLTLGAGVEVANIVTKSIGVEFQYCPNFRKIYTAELLAIKNSSLEFKLVVGF